MIICGVDEAGRGPLAGPVCASAVVFSSKDLDVSLLNDSKKLSEKARLKAFYEITKKAYYAIGWVSNVEIDNINTSPSSVLPFVASILTCLFSFKVPVNTPFL